MNAVAKTPVSMDAVRNAGLAPVLLYQVAGPGGRCCVDADSDERRGEDAGADGRCDECRSRQTLRQDTVSHEVPDDPQ